MVEIYCTFYCTYWGIETLDICGLDIRGMYLLLHFFGYSVQNLDHWGKIDRWSIVLS